MIVYGTNQQLILAQFKVSKCGDFFKGQKNDEIDLATKTKW